jgi:hypothetical protein
MIQTRSDLSNALIPAGTHNAGREPVEYELGGIRVRVEVLTDGLDLTPQDVRRIVIEGVQATYRPVSTLQQVHWAQIPARVQ